MKSITLFTVVVGLALLQGCSMLDMAFLSNQSAAIDDSTYDDEYMSDSTPASVIKSDKEDEMPVQMTKQDTQLHALAPEAKPMSPTTSQSNKNVLLPISSGLE